MNQNFNNQMRQQQERAAQAEQQRRQVARRKREDEAWLKEGRVSKTSAWVQGANVAQPPQSVNSGLAGAAWQPSDSVDRSVVQPHQTYTEPHQSGFFAKVLSFLIAIFKFPFRVLGFLLRLVYAVVTFPVRLIFPELFRKYELSDIKGVANAVERDIEESGGPSSGPSKRVLRFRLERFDDLGNRMPPISVEMRGFAYRGMVNEGEWVQLPPGWREGEVARPSYVRNLTTNTLVRAKLPWRFVTLLKWGFIALVILGFIILFISYSRPY